MRVRSDSPNNSPRANTTQNRRSRDAQSDASEQAHASTFTRIGRKVAQGLKAAVGVTPPRPSNPADEAKQQAKQHKQDIKAVFSGFRSYHGQTSSQEVRAAVQQARASGVPDFAKVASGIFTNAQQARAKRRDDEIKNNIGDYENEFREARGDVRPPSDYEIIFVLQALQKPGASVAALTRQLQDDRIPEPPPQPRPWAHNPAGAERPRAAAPAQQAPAAAAPQDTVILGRVPVASSTLRNAFNPQAGTLQQDTVDSIAEPTWTALRKAFEPPPQARSRRPSKVPADLPACHAVLQACVGDRLTPERLQKQRLILGKMARWVHPDKVPATPKNTAALAALYAMRDALEDTDTVRALIQ